jgi:membrane-associated phospholipid phosphatase
LKRFILTLFLFYSEGLIAQENILYESCSGSFTAFNACLKRDSILSMKSRKGFIPATLHNLGHQAMSPFHMKENEWFIFGGCLILFATLNHYDQEIDDEIKTWKGKNKFVSNVSYNFTDLGDVYGYIFIAGFTGYSMVSHNYRGFRTGILAAKAAITSGLWIRIFKTLSGRMRPGQTYGDPEYKQDHWFGPFAQFNPQYNEHRGIGAFDAFPSGHTGAAFAIATVFAEQYKDVKAVPVVSYSLASFIAITRLIQHEHWTSDIFVGGLIGYLCAKQVVNYERKLFNMKTSSNKKVESMIFPYSEGSIYGLQCNFVF